ncbi:uncharacterized protein LOC125686144 isoform X4 [Lagopus muta]|uniref:uncharacterized protein LOC125686144 isoform X4 n=1 Tax=Lagopus muta TaxID=64668 RepID=UPI0020A0A58C|nr:uncharacterized protein LOC125686144 isoform X4 [Lagopus muta]
MAAEVHFSPREIPEPTLMENVLRSGLFFGAVFQLVCVLAITLPVPKCPETTVEEQSVSGCDIALGLRRTACDCVSSILRGRCQKAASWRAAEQQAVCAMAAEVHFSPREIPEPTLMENVLRSGLFFGAVFQLVCVLAITLPVPKCPETTVEARNGVGAQGSNGCLCHNLPERPLQGLAQSWDSVWRGSEESQGKCCSAEEESPEGEQKEPSRA